jgi:hypothetical protein
MAIFLYWIILQCFQYLYLYSGIWYTGWWTEKDLQVVTASKQGSPGDMRKTTKDSNWEPPKHKVTASLLCYSQYMVILHTRTQTRCWAAGVSEFSLQTTTSEPFVSQKVPRMVVLHCNGRTYGSIYLITFKVWTLRIVHTHTCSIDPAIVGSTGGRLLMESSGVRPSHSIWCPPWLRNVSPWGPYSE